VPVRLFVTKSREQFINVELAKLFGGGAKSDIDAAAFRTGEMRLGNAAIKTKPRLKELPAKKTPDDRGYGRSRTKRFSSEENHPLCESRSPSVPNTSDIINSRDKGGAGTPSP
jgi:hypothetical protein